MKSARPCPTFSISRSSNNTSERQAAEVQVLRLGKKWKLMENNGKSASLDDISTSLVASNVNRKARRNSSFEVAATQDPWTSTNTKSASGSYQEKCWQFKCCKTFWLGATQKTQYTKKTNNKNTNIELCWTKPKHVHSGAHHHCLIGYNGFTR